MQNQTKAIAHSINRAGELVPANGFKKPTPTATPHNYGIWGHSIDRTDSANPIAGFGIFLGVVVVAIIVLKLVG